MKSEDINKKYEHQFHIKFSVFTDEENFYRAPPEETRLAIVETILALLSNSDMREDLFHERTWMKVEKMRN